MTDRALDVDDIAAGVAYDVVVVILVEFVERGRTRRLDAAKQASEGAQHSHAAVCDAEPSLAKRGFCGEGRFRHPALS